MFRFRQAVKRHGKRQGPLRATHRKVTIHYPKLFDEHSNKYHYLFPRKPSGLGMQTFGIPSLRLLFVLGRIPSHSPATLPRRTRPRSRFFSPPFKDTQLPIRRVTAYPCEAERPRSPLLKACVLSPCSSSDSLHRDPTKWSSPTSCEIYAV